MTLVPGTILNDNINHDISVDQRFSNGKFLIDKIKCVHENKMSDFLLF